MNFHNKNENKNRHNISLARMEATTATTATNAATMTTEMEDQTTAIFYSEATCEPELCAL